MATNPNLQAEYNRKQLIGIGLETAFDGYVPPTMFLPTAGIDLIEDKQDLIQADVPLGKMVRPEQAFSVFGIGKGSVKLKIGEVPWVNALGHIFAQMLTLIETTSHIAPDVGAHSHVLTSRETPGKAMNMDVGLSLTEWDGVLRRKLSGCRIVGFEIAQEQNKPATLDLDVEGSTYAEDETSASPAIELLTDTPFLMASQLTALVDNAAQEIIGCKLAAKFKHTGDDQLQPTGAAARSKIDLVQIDDVALTIKRHLLLDEAGGAFSKYLEAYRAKTAFKSNQLKWEGQVIVGLGSIPWTLQFDIAAMRIDKLDDIKQTVVGGAIVEEVTFHAITPTTPKALLIATVINGSATPADQS